METDKEWKNNKVALKAITRKSRELSNNKIK